MSHAALKQDPQPEQSAAMERPHQANNLPVGEILRRARVHYGHSIANVESTLRIPAIQLEAIEGGHYDALPARVYAIGFVRSYAKYLGLDSEKIVSLFKAQSANSAVSPDLHFPVGAEQSSLPSKWIIMGAIAVLMLIPLTRWYFSAPSTNETNIVEIPPVSEELTQSVAMNMSNANVEISPDFAQPLPTTTVAGQSTNQQPTPAIAATAEKKGIILRIIENSWVEIRDSSGKRLVSRVLKAGDQYFVPDRPDLKMSIGNAGGVEISIDGNTLPPLGKPGSVVRNISLDITALKALEKEH